MNPTALVIFAKCPVPGHVNTRLQPQVSPQDSARLQEAWILDTIEKVKDITGVDAFMACAPSEHTAFFQELKSKTGIELFMQQGNSLGLKIQNAFSEMFDRGYGKMAVIGVDSPTFPPELIEEAATLLDAHDVVFGPSTDGGYYLAGMSNKAHPIFPDDELGTEDVLQKALDRVSVLNLRVSTLPPWYDLDTHSDIKFACSHIHLLAKSGKYFPIRTKEILEEIVQNL